MAGYKVKRLVLGILLASFILGTEGQKSKSKRKVRGKKSRADQTTVVSCRVFRRGVCPLSNRIKGLTGITSHGKCQEACYSFNGCSAFTYYRKGRVNCNLFSNCNGKLGKCNDCVSGPVMPRVRECLAERQVMAPKSLSEDKKNCSLGYCKAFCVGPKCQELVREGARELVREGARLTTEPTPTVTNARQTLGDYDTTVESDYDVEDVELDEVETIYDDAYYSDDDYDDGTAGTVPSTEEDYGNIDDNQDTATDYYDTEYDNAVEPEVETVPSTEETDVEQIDLDDTEYDVRVDTTLQSEGIEEDEFEAEEVEVNIDSGLLSDPSGVVAELPVVKQNITQIPQPTYIFYFCAVGGLNNAGGISAIDMLNIGQSAGFTIPPLPSALTKGSGEVMSSYTGSSILSCSPGYTILTPYGFQYLPGACYDYSLAGNTWQSKGGRLTSYRQGASMLNLGRYLLAIGGHREKRRLRSIEAYDTRRPRKGWKRVPRMVMPAATSQHCSVTMKGETGKEILIIGGKGRENRVMKYGVNTNRWYSLNRLSEGRRQHACAKVKMNGRPGVIVSGGRNRHAANLTSVEFYDAKTGVWFKMPSLNIGRKGHQMTLRDGLLTVIGGEMVGRRGRKLYLDNSEVFTGKRWVKSKMKLDKPRSGFSLVKIPRKVQRKSLRTRNG